MRCVEIVILLFIRTEAEGESGLKLKVHSLHNVHVKGDNVHVKSGLKYYL